MFEKDLYIGFLLDFYGDLLGEHKREALSMYFNEDLSLSEIAEVMGISRQGVRNIIKKAGDELLFYEEKLGLVGRFRELRDTADRICAMSRQCDLPEELRREIEHLSSLV
ncbi:MAG: sigma factor-like helix-turn-helix DNA-binding protein [Eubacteriales bacterium]